MNEMPTTGDVVIVVRQMDGGGWESDVAVSGEWCGGGTGPTPSSALDTAMDILYGDKNDWLNGDHGALSRLEDEPGPEVAKPLDHAEDDRPKGA